MHLCYFFLITMSFQIPFKSDYVPNGSEMICSIRARTVWRVLCIFKARTYKGEEGSVGHRLSLLPYEILLEIAMMESGAINTDFIKSGPLAHAQHWAQTYHDMRGQGFMFGAYGEKLQKFLAFHPLVAYYAVKIPLPVTYGLRVCPGLFCGKYQGVLYRSVDSSFNVIPNAEERNPFGNYIQEAYTRYMFRGEPADLRIIVRDRGIIVDNYEPSRPNCHVVVLSKLLPPLYTQILLTMNGKYCWYCMMRACGYSDNQKLIPYACGVGITMFTGAHCPLESAAMVWRCTPCGWDQTLAFAMFESSACESALLNKI